MGHAQASHLTQSLTELLKDLGYVSKTFQVSMDETHVKWFLLDNLSIHWKEGNINAPDLMNIGSYSLHIVHSPFSTASRKTDWNLLASLKSFYKNCKESPARQADYLKLNGLNEMYYRKYSSYLFPMKHCGHI